MQRKNITRQAFIAAIERGIHATPELRPDVRRALRHVAEHSPRAAACTYGRAACACPLMQATGRVADNGSGEENFTDAHDRWNFTGAYDRWIQAYFGVPDNSIASFELTVLG
jgi:hypothetical protein